MDASPLSRERLLHSAAAGGDAAAWAELFNTTYDDVFRYALWRCGGRADLAEDVVQDAWLLATRKVRAFDPTRGPFAAWVCGLAANVARNVVRARLRHARTLAAVPVPSGDVPEHDPELVAVVLAELPPDYEVVLRGKYFNRQSVGELAAEMGKSAKAVESLLTRAREAFRVAYRRLGGTDHD
jgi:RNA polymerase sigma-70 factor (ECF subfamily)